ncbi:MAG: hypothetical protein ACJ8F7_02115 [Gemmataceae bacterium]
MNETTVMSLLVLTLLAVAGVYTWRSIRTLRRTTLYHEMLPDDRRYLRRQGWRRLVNSVLMLLFAGLMAGSYVFGLQKRADELGERNQQARAEGRTDPMAPEDREFSRFYGGYWIATLLVLGAIVAIAGLDLWATRRYGLRKFRQIQSDRRAMLQRQLERYRQERDGLGPPD